MRRPFLWLAVGLAIASLAGAFLWPGPVGPTIVPLSGGKELRVLKVSLGTNHVFSSEPVWKQALRRVLPPSLCKPLGPFQGSHVTTPHDSLVLSVAVFPASSNAPPSQFSRGLYQIDAILPDGSIFPGRMLANTARFVGHAFSSFDRAAPRIALRARDGDRWITFTVPNPHPVRRRAPWIGGPLPQTNHSHHTDIIIRQSRALERAALNLQTYKVLPVARPSFGEYTGWMQWRVTAFDVWGNWTGGEVLSSQGIPIAFSKLPSNSFPWRLLVEGQEYLSAGFVPSLPNGACFLMTPDSRAQGCGIHLTVAVGCGTFRIGPRHVAQTSSTPPGSDALTFAPNAHGTNWVLDLTTSLPGILCVSDLSSPRHLLLTRLRERIEADQGHIFPPLLRKDLAATNQETKQIARFFPVKLSFVTTNLEAELIVALPPSEFFIHPHRD